MNNLKGKTYFYPIILTILIFVGLLITPAFINRVYSKDLFGLLFCIYFIASILIIKKNDSRVIKLSKILIILAPGVIIYFLYPLVTWNLRFLPHGFSVVFSGIFAYILYNKNVVIKLGICIAMITLGLFGYPKYTLELSYQESLVNEELNQNLILNRNISSNLLEKSEQKLVILEFWNSACGQCIEAFPEFQKFYDTQRHEFEIFSVNIPWERDKVKNFDPKQFVDSLGYNFPILSMEYAEAKKLGVNVFPTVVVIDNRIIKYRGRLIYGNSSKYHFYEVLKKIKK